MLTFPAKQIRAEVIAAWCREAGIPGAVAFSCGNATAALKAAGLWVVDVAPGGALQAGKWWTQAEIRRTWPHLLDATSGHLPPELMQRIAAAFREHIGALTAGPHRVPTGSGETIVCLAMAYPDSVFVPVYGEGATAYQEGAPLNALVRALKAA